MPLPQTTNPKELAGEGWLKELTLHKIVERNGIIYCEEWDFFADSKPCQDREGAGGGLSGSDKV